MECPNGRETWSGISLGVFHGLSLSPDPVAEEKEGKEIKLRRDVV